MSEHFMYKTEEMLSSSLVSTVSSMSPKTRLSRAFWNENHQLLICNQNIHQPLNHNIFYTCEAFKNFAMLQLKALGVLGYISGNDS